MRTGPLIAATAVVATVVALVAVPAADALLDQLGVKTSRLYEQQPAAATDGGAEYFAWSQNARTRKNHFDAFLSRTGDPRVKLNRKGLGYIGGIDPPVVAYQQVVKGNSDLKLYDVDTQARSDPPAGVNTSNWEWEPSISGDWLLFARQTNSAQFVILRSLTTAAKVVLDQGRRFHHAGQVSDDYAVWTRCGKTACNVVRRQLSTATDTVLARPADRFQYGAAVTSTGIVYVARSSPKCGGSVKIARFFGAGDAADGTVVADLGANGWDLWSAYARENDDESVDVFYDRLLCGGNKADIYRVHDPHPGP
jgi:hypothetical protein